MSDFPTQVGVQPAPAVEGDFASSNPRNSVLAGPGGFVAGASGLTIGRFCWRSQTALDGDGAPAILNSFGNGVPVGFVGRNQQGLITAYLGASGMQIQAGFPCFAYSAGDFWVKNNGTTVAQVNQKAFANNLTGAASFGAAGAAASSASITGTIAAATNSFTGSIAGNVLTVTALTTGTIVAGTLLTGTAGSGIASGTNIVGQLSGTTGGVGTYAIDVPGQTIPSGPITGTYGLLTATGVTGGSIGIGQTLSGTGGGGVTSGTTITGLGTGTGGAGTYYVDPTQTVTTSTFGAALATETKWYAQSVGLVGELVKISSTTQGV